MNCKEGDLAIFVRSRAGNEGKIVCCVRLSRVTKMIGPDSLLEEVGPSWEIETAVKSWDGTLG